MTDGFFENSLVLRHVSVADKSNLNTPDQSSKFRKNYALLTPRVTVADNPSLVKLTYVQFVVRCVLKAFAGTFDSFAELWLETMVRTGITGFWNLAIRGFHTFKLLKFPF